MDKDDLAFNMAYALYVAEIIEYNDIWEVKDILRNEIEKEDLIKLE